MIAGLDILNLHAQGGMAEVYRARGKGADGTEYFYAVKRILPEYTRDPEIKRMFIEESRVASLLVHPNVVRVYDLATSEADDLFIVMEFLEGKDLSEAIEEGQNKKKALPIWFALQVAKEVCLALDYVTTKAVDKNGRPLGLIHRDISPHNIFLCFDGQVKLTDFGVAKVQESNVKTQVGITKGKLGYMSPEQLMGSPLDFRSDLYNVGILLYETIVGKQLFAGASTADFLQAMVRGIVPAIPPGLQVPQDLEGLIRRALDRDRNKRPASGAEFAREIEIIAQRYNLTAQPGHIAHILRELYGKPEAPKPAAVATPKLKSMRLALGAAQPDLGPALAPNPPAAAQPGYPPQAGGQYPPQYGAGYGPPQQGYGAPYGAPQHGAPQHGGPGYGGPGYGGPGYGGSPYGTPPQGGAPQYGTPPYASPQGSGPPGASAGASVARAAPAADDRDYPDDDAATVLRPIESLPVRPPPPRDRVGEPPVPSVVVDESPSLSAVFDNVEVAAPPTTRPINQRPATIAHGNARALSVTSGTPMQGWNDVTGDEPPDATRIESSPMLQAPPRAEGKPPPAPPTRAPTVQVGGASVGGKKKVVPLDDTRKR